MLKIPKYYLPRYRKRNMFAVNGYVEFAVAAEGEPIGGGGYQNMLFLNDCKPQPLEICATKLLENSKNEV